MSNELPPQGTCRETGPSAVIYCYVIRVTPDGYEPMYVQIADRGSSTLNSDRDYAHKFDSEQQARAIAETLPNVCSIERY